MFATIERLLTGYKFVFGMLDGAIYHFLFNYNGGLKIFSQNPTITFNSCPAVLSLSFIMSHSLVIHSCIFNNRFRRYLG